VKNWGKVVIYTLNKTPPVSLVYHQVYHQVYRNKSYCTSAIDGLRGLGLVWN